jgi:hypothetical protein
MPQIQVLPANPGFGSQLGQALGGGLGQGLSQGISAGLQNMLEQKQQQQKISQIFSALGIQTPQAGTSHQGMTHQTSSGQMPQRPSGLQDWTPEKVAAVSLIDPQFGNVAANLYGAQQKQYEKQRDYETARSNKYLDKVGDLASNLDERRIAIDSAKAAIESGQMKPFGGDFFADVLHLPQLRTQSGAQLATAAKINLIGSLSQITGGRPNQFIETQIDKAFAKAGQSKAANLSQISIIEAKLDLDQKMAQLADQIADQYRKELGYVPESIDRDVRKAIQPYAQQRMQKLAYNLRENLESDVGVNKLSKLKPVMKGTPLTVKMAKILYDKYGEKAEDEAIKLGFEIPADEIWKK